MPISHEAQLICWRIRQAADRVINIIRSAPDLVAATNQSHTLVDHIKRQEALGLCQSVHYVRGELRVCRNRSKNRFCGLHGPTGVYMASKR